MSRRVWRYSYRDWQPRWWYYLLPYRGGDELGRRTLVFHVPLFGFVVVAYWMCRCGDCDEVRRQTATWETEEGEAARAVLREQG